MSLTVREIAKSIEHAALKTDVTSEIVKREAKLAKTENTRAFVVHPINLHLANECLKGTDVLAVPVADFPHGRDLTDTRIYTLASLYLFGAEEIDIVSQYQRLKSGDLKGFKDDLDNLVEVSLDGMGTLKIILEVDELTKAQIEDAVKIIMDIVAAKQEAKLFIKTKTGFAKEVKIDNLDAVNIIVPLLKANNMYGEEQGHIRVKASDGTRDLDTLLALKNAGAHVIGTSSTKAIMDEARVKLQS